MFLNSSDFLVILSSEIPKDVSVIKIYEIASYKIKISYLSMEFFEILSPAIKHLEIDDASYDLQIIVGQVTLENFILKEESIKTHLFPIDDDVLADYHPHSNRLYVLDRKKNLAYFLVEDISGLTQSDRSAPFAKIFRWWMSDRGIQLLHSACIALDNKGILLSAKGGSGKSTTAINCLSSGFSYLSDDYCLVSAKDNFVKAYSLYNSAKLYIENVTKDNKLSSIEHENDPGTEKALFYLHKRFDILKCVDIKALFFPRIFDGFCAEIVPITKSKALEEIISSSLFHILRPNKNDFYQLTSIINALPCYDLCLGNDMSDILGKLRSFIQTA